MVSVVIPLYNAEAYIEKAVQSILDQTYTDWELLICDDGSTDNSLKIVKEFSVKDNRIRVVENEINKGHVYTYNRLFFCSKGEYIMIQDADDWSDKDRIAKQVAILEQYNVGLCLTNSVFYSPNSIASYFPKKQTGIIDIYTTEHWAPATIMFRRFILEKIPGYNAYFDRLTSMDRYFIMEVLQQYKGYYLEENLYFVQVRTDSDHRSIKLSKPEAMKKLIITDIYWELKRQRLQTNTDWLKEKDFYALQQFENKLLRNHNLIAEKIRVFACIQIDHNKFSNAMKLLLRAIAKAPFYLKNYRTMLYLIRFYLIKA